VARGTGFSRTQPRGCVVSRPVEADSDSEKFLYRSQRLGQKDFVEEMPCFPMGFTTTLSLITLNGWKELANALNDYCLTSTEIGIL
jgi:hypothetical protein